MNPDTINTPSMPISVQVAVQRDHFRLALKKILEYAEPPNSPFAMSVEEIAASYNALKDIARRALQTCPPIA